MRKKTIAHPLRNTGGKLTGLQTLANNCHFGGEKEVLQRRC
jgi:hypothetical protein